MLNGPKLTVLYTFGVPFRTTQCTCESVYKLVTEDPSEVKMRTDILKLFNDARRAVATETIAADLYYLTWDMSLTWHAIKAVDYCDDSPDPSGLRYLRFRLTDKYINDKFSRQVIEDLWIDLDTFIYNVKLVDQDLMAAIPLERFELFSNFYRSNVTRIGCSFKLCTNQSKDSNLVCFLGSSLQKPVQGNKLFRTAESLQEVCKNCQCVKGMCKAPSSLDNMTNEELKAKTKAVSMPDLIWDNSLAVSAQRKGDGCPTEPEHATTVRDLAADDFLTDTDFPVLGEMYGYTTLEVMPNEYYERTGFYTILWPKMTKVGCARTPHCTQQVFCHFGDIGKLEGKMYEKDEL
uniref:SCP domain-containing protein n=1 Tax=Caenorhabditis japonica TaxID=281687 RepID=A0A8R1E234_CAEJA